MVLLTAIFSFQSCELEDNTFIEGESNSVMAKELLGVSIAKVAYNQSAIGGRSAAIIMQYLQEEDAVIQYYKQYRLDADFFENMWTKGYYAGSLSSLEELRRLAISESNEAIQSISLILLANEYAMLTNMFGDIPFSEALKGELASKPKYDSQQKVYIGITELLNEAIDLIGDKSTEEAIREEDLIYQGNLQGWKKLAYGLKARNLLNQRNQDSSKDAELMSFIENSFNSRSEQAAFTFTSEIINPQFSYGIERPSTLKLGDEFLDQLSTFDDPRKSLFTVQDGNLWKYFDRNSFIPLWYDQYATIPILSYTELLFIKAELSFHMNNNVSETSSLLKEAIIANMLDNDVTDPNTNSFVADASDLTALSDTEVLQRIMDQSYLAYYGYNHLQTWNNWRRTGYPILATTATSPNENNPSNSIPKRFLYPESELEFNLENVQAAISGQGGALLDSGMWLYN